MWLVAGSATAKTLQEINLLTGKIVEIVPIGAEADSLAESPEGTLAVGYSTPAGSVEFRNSSSGALIHAVTVGAPVKAIAAGDGTTFYVLNGNATETSVDTVSSTGAAEPPSIGVALNTIGLAAGSAGDALFLLQNSGTVVDTPLGGAPGQTLANATFSVGSAPIQLAVSPDGSTLFILKNSGSTINVGVFSVATERQLRVLPAPAHSVDVVTSLDGAHFYALVGTPRIGNIQVYPVDG